MYESKLKELSALLEDPVKQEIDTFLQQPNSSFFYDHLYNIKEKNRNCSSKVIKRFNECLDMFLDYYKIENLGLIGNIEKSIKVSTFLSCSLFKNTNSFEYHMRDTLFKIKRQKYNNYTEIIKDLETGEMILQGIDFKNHSPKLVKTEKRKIFVIRGYLTRAFRDVKNLYK